MLIRKWLAMCCMGVILNALVSLPVWAEGESTCEDLFKSKQFNQALPVCLESAKQGHIDAQFNLGIMYTFGKGVEESYVDAAQWYRKAAEQGFGKAQLNLGLMYDKGQGVEQSYVDAAQWYRKAAEQGDASAQFNLGIMYTYGKGVEQSYVDAEQWYRKAAEQGLGKAQYNLGIMYDKGKGVEQSYVDAAQWYRKAAEQGDASAQFNLGVMYAYGKGVMKSGAASADWYYKSGISSFINNDREGALQCVERIQGLQKHLNLSVPNAFLADKLLKKIYANNKIKKADGKAKKQQYVTGTGWPVKGGYVVTNNHVIAGHASIVLLRSDGAKTPAHVVLTDTVNDLALLLPEDKTFLPTALPLAEMIADVGEQVFTLGYPHPDMMGKEAKLTDGIINSRTGMRNDPRVYQISVQLQSGNSGGPPLNMHGEVVGVRTSKMSAVKVFKWTGDLPQNVNYAVKIGYLKMLLSAVDPANDLPLLEPLKGGSLRDLSKHIEGSVLMIIAK